MSLCALSHLLEQVVGSLHIGCVSPGDAEFRKVNLRTRGIQYGVSGPPRCLGFHATDGSFDEIEEPALASLIALRWPLLDPRGV